MENPTSGPAQRHSPLLPKLTDMEVPSPKILPCNGPRWAASCKSCPSWLSTKASIMAPTEKLQYLACLDNNLVLWTGDSEQTPGGIARTAPNAKRSRQLLLAKQHGLRSDRNYYMPSNLAEAMIRLFDGSSNEGLFTLAKSSVKASTRWVSYGRTNSATIHRRPGGGKHCPP